MALLTKERLFNLLHHLVESQPNGLKKGEPHFDVGILSSCLGRELAGELLSALNEMRLELVPWHANDGEIITAFWDDLVCEVVTRPEMYPEDSSALEGLVDQFGSRWKTPLFEFEVTYAVDYLAVGPEPITLRGVEFFSPTDESLAQRNISDAEFIARGREEGTFSLAVARVRAAGAHLVFEAGKQQVVDALALMKLAALRGLASRTPTDELLQWKLSGQYSARPVTTGEPSEGHTYGSHSQFRPLVDYLGGCIRRGIDDLKLELLSGLPEDIHDRICRSIYWIVHSTTHEADDHKLIDLCTALEILLLPEGPLERYKGTTISLRYHLLGGDLNPSAVKGLYDRRNEVIHGGLLPVVAPLDTWHLRLVCYTTVNRIISASAERPDLLTLTDLLGTFETKVKLTTFIKLAERGMYSGPFVTDLVKGAQAKLR